MSKNPDAGEMYENGARQETAFINVILTRYPVGCSALLIAVGIFMIAGMYFVPIPAILLIVGALLIIFGVILLLIWLGSIAAQVMRRVSTPPADPVLILLRSVGDSSFARRTYDESKTEMTKFVAEKMFISREEAGEKIDKLEKLGKIVYLPTGRWAMNE